MELPVLLRLGEVARWSGRSRSTCWRLLRSSGAEQVVPRGMRLGFWRRADVLRVFDGGLEGDGPLAPTARGRGGPGV